MCRQKQDFSGVLPARWAPEEKKSLQKKNIYRRELKRIFILLVTEYLYYEKVSEISIFLSCKAVGDIYGPVFLVIVYLILTEGTHQYF